MPLIAGADLIVELGILLLCIALLLTRKAWVSTFGALLESLAKLADSWSVGFSVFGHGVTIGFGFVAKALRSINASALHLLGAGIQATEYAAKRLWQWTGYLLEATARVVGGLAEWTYAELRHLVRVIVPGYVSARLHPLASKVEWIIHRLAHLAEHPSEILHTVTRVLDPRVSTLEREVETLTKAVASAGAVPIPLPVPVPTLRLGWVKTGIDDLRRWVGTIGRTLTPAGILGLTAAAVLSSLDLGWLKCRGVGRIGRGLCGLSGLIETLASDAIEALIVSDLCQFVGALNYAARQFEPVLVDFAAVEGALIGCHGYSAPADLEPPAFPLPPLQTIGAV